MKQIAIKIIIIILIISLLTIAIILGVRAVKLNEYKNTELKLPNDFTITAHTGCMGTDENTLDSMNIGVQNGAKIIEFDVHFDKNGYPVLAHDEPTGDELKLDVAFEFLSSHKDTRANVDMKSVLNMKKVQDLAVKYGVLDQIFFTGIKDEFVETVKKDSPLISYYLNVDADKSKNTDEEYLLSLVDKVKKSGAVGINFNYKSASKDLVDILHKNELLVSIWTVDKEYDMYKILTMSPDNITTRNPHKLSKILG